MKKYGFTMAEILITIGIIGIVAAMTLPSVINDSRNKQLEASLNRSYSVISQALDMYQAEIGEKVTSENIGLRKLKSILMKYIQTAKDCDWGHTGYYDAAITNKASIRNYSSASALEDDTTYKNYTGTNNILLTYFDDGQFVMNDGSLILIENNGSELYISIDVNGYNKNPNRLGQDLFMFQIDKKGALLPMGVEGMTYYSKTSNYCSLTSTGSLNGAGYTYNALTDKDYFKNLPK